MKLYLTTFSLLCLMAFSCSFRDDDMFIETVVVRDSVYYNPDINDSVHIKNDFIVLEESDSIDFNIEKIEFWTSQIRGKRGKQGGDAYNGYLFQFESRYKLDIIDIKNKRPVTTIEPEYNSNYPCNNADFSNTFYDKNDEFPLLYSSQYAKNARCIVVDRIYKQEGNYMTKIVQRIDLPPISEVPLYSPDAVLDKKNGCLYVYVGDFAPVNDFYIYKFRLPSIEEGKVVQLKREDIISKWIMFDKPVPGKQGGGMVGGFLITLEGTRYSKMRVIDLEKNRYKIIDLTTEYNAKGEPEDIFEVDGNIFLATAGTGIYQFVLSNKE